MCHFLQGLLLDRGHKGILHQQEDKNGHKQKKTKLQLKYKESYWKHSTIVRFVATPNHGIPIANYHVIENLSSKKCLLESLFVHKH
jgi:hypothetical protein